MANTEIHGNALISLNELFSTVSFDLDLLEHLKNAADHCRSLQLLTFHRDLSSNSGGGELFILSRDQDTFLALLAQEWRRQAKTWSSSDQADFEKFTLIPEYALCALYPLNAAPTKIKPEKAQKIIRGFFEKKISVIRLHDYRRFFRSPASSPVKRSLSFDIEVYEHAQE